MSKHVDTIRLGLTAFMRGDAEAALATTTPDVVAFREVPDAHTYHGREGIMRMWADWTGEFAEFEMTAGEFTEVGDRVVAEITQRATGNRGGAEVEARFWFVYTFAGESVQRLDAFASRQRAMEAASESVRGGGD